MALLSQVSQASEVPVQPCYPNPLCNENKRECTRNVCYDHAIQSVIKWTFMAHRLCNNVNIFLFHFYIQSSKTVVCLQPVKKTKATNTQTKVQFLFL